MFTEASIQQKVEEAKLRGVKDINSLVYRLRHPDIRAAQKRRHYLKYKDRNAVHRLVNKPNRQRYDKQRVRRPHVRHATVIRRYGITQADFNHMRIAQHNRCAICREVFTKTPRVDHNHDSGKVRGLLCGPCNIGIGLLKDSAVRLRMALRYLEAHPG